MKNGVESIKHRKTEGHDRLLLRSGNVAIAFSFKKKIPILPPLYIFARHVKKPKVSLSMLTN